MNAYNYGDYGKSRYQEMIEEAAAFRRFPKSDDSHLKRVGRLLVSLGQKLQGQPATIEVRPPLTVK